MNRTALTTVMLLALVACEAPIPEPEPPPKVEKKAAAPEPKDLVIEDVKVGTGAKVAHGDKIKVHYTGRLKKTKLKFDSSLDKGEPFEFTVGTGVIEGWSKGVVDMKVGGKRKLTIPSKLGYGDTGSPPKIPPKATLEFDIELLSIDGKDDGATAGAGSAAPDASAAPAVSAAPAAGSAAAAAPPKKTPAAPPKKAPTAPPKP